MSLGAALHDAFAQAWPPFALVAGLLAVGAAADAEGLFRWAARIVARPGASPVAVLAGLLTLDAAVTAVLNLDTATAFLTPLMLYAARGLGAREAPFLYGSVLMANASSLLLPGANLTNLLVLGGEEAPGSTFFARMLPASLLAAAVTGLGLVGWALRTPSLEGTRAATPLAGPEPLGPATAAVGVCAVLVLVLPQPALPVLAAGLGVAAWRLGGHGLVRAVGPLTLLALLVLAVALGTVAREWGGLERWVASLTRWETTGAAAAASVVVNNLPVAALLSAHAPAHPRALLVGLDLGPNLAVTGSLSALIWWRVARRLGAAPSIVRYSLAGAPLAVAAMVVATFSLRG